MPVLVLKTGGAVAGIALAPVVKQNIRPTRKTLSLLLLSIALFDTFGYVSWGRPCLRDGLATAGHHDLRNGWFLPRMLWDPAS